jgi:preprotein translocase subunit YajC
LSVLFLLAIVLSVLFLLAIVSGQKKQYKGTNNVLQNIHVKLKIK